MGYYKGLEDRIVLRACRRFMGWQAGSYRPESKAMNSDHSILTL